MAHMTSVIPKDVLVRVIAEILLLFRPGAGMGKTPRGRKFDTNSDGIRAALDRRRE
jgi:hypothetical protein